MPLISSYPEKTPLASTDHLLGYQADGAVRVFPGSAISGGLPLIGTGATVTANAPLLDLTQTWNNAGITFQAIKTNITNTASAVDSKLIDLQVGNVSQFSVNKSGQILVDPQSSGTISSQSLVFRNGDFGFYSDLSGVLRLSFSGQSDQITLFFDGGVGPTIKANAFHFDSSNGDVRLFRDAAGILAQRNATSPQVFRLYNTFSDASNYERGILSWSSNIFKVGTEAAGTGTLRLMTLSAGRVEFLINNTYQASVADGGTGFSRVNVDAIAFNYANGDVGISRSAAGVLAFGNGANGDASATIKAKTKAGAPTTTDVPSGTWALIRDTSGATTKLYYNNAGTLQSVALT